MTIIRIGRSSTNNVVINNDLTVSRKHCELIVDDKGICRLRDLDSWNGVYVNGRKISGEVILSKYDTVRIGNTLLPWRSYIETNNMRPQGTPKDNKSLPNPIVKIPEKIDINKKIERSDVLKRGADFKVPFLRNLGDKMGNLIGSTLGCIMSVAIILMVMVLFGILLNTCS